MTVTGKRYVDCTVLETGNTGDGEDSSYDSDYEAEDSIGSTTTHSQLELQVSSSSHFDVSRTTSDTLAAEFAEYVTVQESPPSQTPGYAARVEFALKLGYTERLVQAALQKLGPDPEQNELLAELIRLGANCPQKLTDSPEEANGFLDGDLTSDEGGGCSLNSSVLRPIVIDGSNVAMSHGNKEVFSCRGIKICVDWFRSRGHKEITVFVPKWRKEASRLDNPIADQEILGELEKDRLLVFTPSRLVGGKRMVCYDDRYILRLAAEVDGIVVSNDNYRDLAQESPEFRKVVEERILMYSFVNDRFMPPDDPLGRSGPTLENFLRVSSRKNDPPAPPCPYAKKCTYGNKCKFRHPERGPQPQKSVTERLVEHAQRHLQARGPSLSLPLPGTSSSGSQCPPLCKTRSLTTNGSSQSLASVTKSKSAENVTSDQSVSAWGYGQSSAAGQTTQGYRSSSRQAGRTNNPEGEPPNTHRKLQRQLTLNPVFDPRLYQLRRYHQQSPQTSSSSPSTSTNQQSGICTTGVPHKPLTRHSSNEYPLPMSWGPTESSPRHQHVARIASAPESYQFWPPRSSNQVTGLPQSQQRLAISDPQLRPVTSYPVAASPVYMGSRFTADRTRALDQLCLIFPDEYVNIVMNMHPYVTDPKVVIPILKEMTVPLSMPRYKH